MKSVRKGLCILARVVSPTFVEQSSTRPNVGLLETLWCSEGLYPAHFGHQSYHLKIE